MFKLNSLMVFFVGFFIIETEVVQLLRADKGVIGTDVIKGLSMFLLGLH